MFYDSIQIFILESTLLADWPVLFWYRILGDGGNRIKRFQKCFWILKEKGKLQSCGIKLYKRILKDILSYQDYCSMTKIQITRFHHCQVSSADSFARNDGY